MKRLFANLTFQVLIAIVLGIVVGLYFKSFAPTAQLISKTFISLITMLIAPIIFFTIALGIAGMKDMKKVGQGRWQSAALFRDSDHVRTDHWRYRSQYYTAG